MVRIPLNDERKSRLEELAEEYYNGNKSETIRELIDDAHEQYVDDGRDEYHPLDERPERLSTDDLAEIVREYDAPVIHPEHLPTTVPRDSRLKHELVAAVMRWRLATEGEYEVTVDHGVVEGEMTDDAVRTASDVLWITGETAEGHAEAALDLLRQHGVESDTSFPVQLGIDRPVRWATRMQTLLKRDPPKDSLIRRKNQGKRMLDSLSADDPRVDILRDIVEEFEAAAEAADA